MPHKAINFMDKGVIIVAGIGPGNADDVTPAVQTALGRADVVVGYKYYFQFVQQFLQENTRCVDTGMKNEMARAAQAFQFADEGLTVCVISSGDAGIYGMASLIYEMKHERGDEKTEIVCLPGISAFQKAASLLGAPISTDFCVISLSDLMVPWEQIERRIRAAATGDFVTAVYNPRSNERYWQLYRLRELFLEERSPETPVGYVRQAGRDGQEVCLTTLGDLNPESIDMFTIILIGNSQSFRRGNSIITPRGYFNRERGMQGGNKGQDIMMHSFQTIERELKNPGIPPERKWLLLHAIHTTADFEMENLLKMDEGAAVTLYNAISSGKLRTIITDVTMAASGIRKGALQRLGVEVKCYLSDSRTSGLAAEKGITRTQAGIRLAVEEHPDALFVFGNAPTALMELCELIHKGKAHPAGIIAAPVGFVHVEESKQRVKAFRNVPKIIIEGRKGGSNLAATLVNAILCFNDASQLKPGRDV